MALNLTFATGVAVTIGAAELSLISGTTTLQTNNVPGVYSLWLNCAAITATESYELRIYETVVAGSTKGIARRRLITGAQTEPVLVMQALEMGVGWDITLKRVGTGTDRAFDWSIRTVV